MNPALFHNSLQFTWMGLEYSKSVEGNFHMSWLVEVTWHTLGYSMFKFGFGVNITTWFVKGWEDDILVWPIRQLYQQILNYHIWLVGVCWWVQAIFLKNVQQNHESAVNKSPQYLAFQVTNIGDRFKGMVSAVLQATYTPIKQGVEMINCTTVLIVCTSF